MVEGKGYRVALRRWDTLHKPDIVVYDAKTGRELGALSWDDGAYAFGIR